MTRITSANIAANITQTIDGTTTPSTTVVTGIIDDAYKQVYTIMYPTKFLHTTDDSTDTDGLVDNAHVYGMLISWLSNTINDHFFSGEDTDGEYRMATWELPPKLVKKLQSWKEKYLVVKKLQIDNVPIWGSEIRDYYRVGH